MTREDSRTVTLTAYESDNIDTVCYRGTAALADLTMISQADTFDQVTNPQGIQRDLSKKHAREAYEYVMRDADAKVPRAFPEVMLNVRDPKVIKIKTVQEIGGHKVVTIEVDMEAIAKSRAVKVSRVDGNHRLYYGAGDSESGLEPTTDVQVPFSILVGLTRDQEASLFSDVNANQKGMNTSHLASLRGRLTKDEIMLIHEPHRVFARRLTEDAASPWHGKVHMGGSKAGAAKKGITYPVTLVALESAVRRMLRTSEALRETADPDLRYGMIRNYWQAVAATWPEAFEKPGDYLLVKSIGINSLAQFAGKVIDRCYLTGNLTAEDMAALLANVKDTIRWERDVDHHEGGVRGLNGNSAVLAISELLTKALPSLKTTRKSIAQAQAELEAEDRAKADELLAAEA